jgi:hypothetical protein
MVTNVDFHHLDTKKRQRQRTLRATFVVIARVTEGSSSSEVEGRGGGVRRHRCEVPPMSPLANKFMEIKFLKRGCLRDEN